MLRSALRPPAIRASFRSYSAKSLSPTRVGRTYALLGITATALLVATTSLKPELLGKDDLRYFPDPIASFSPSLLQRFRFAGLLLTYVLTTIAIQPLQTEAALKSHYLDPTTQTPFPSSIISPKGRTLKLVGTGVRTVSFLSIKVYAVGFYVDQQTLEGPLVKGFQEVRLVKAAKGKEIANPSGETRGEEFIGEMLELGNDVAAVISQSVPTQPLSTLLTICSLFKVPQRSTSLPHLRDGFARALVARLKLPFVSNAITDEESEICSSSIIELKGYFANRPLAKGAPLFVFYNGSDKSVQFSLLVRHSPSHIISRAR